MIPADIPAHLQDDEDAVYVSTRQASALMHVAPCTITRWRTRGYLTPIPGSPPRRPMYRWKDVIGAEYKAWEAAVAASGTDRHLARDRRRCAA